MSDEHGQSDDDGGGGPLRERELRDLKKRIAAAKRRRDLPLDSNLGDPDWEDQAADGRFDLPDEEEE